MSKSKKLPINDQPPSTPPPPNPHRKRGRPKKQPLPPPPPPAPREEIDRAPQPPQPSTDAPPTSLILGDGSLRPGRYNMAVVRKAIKEGYPISDAIRQLVTSQMAMVVGRSDSEKNRIAAAKVLVTADAQNVKRAELALRTEAFETDVENGTNRNTVNVNITLEATQQQAELAALAAEIRSGRVVEGLFTEREAIDCGADGTPRDSGTQGKDGHS